MPNLKEKKDLMDYVPDVYQEDIYGINYKKLKEHGIKLITFDVNDTIISGDSDLPDEVVIFFTKLRRDYGFRIMLVSNSNNEAKIKRIAERLHAEKYVARAKKPDPKYFEEIMEVTKLDASQIAHIGNSLTNDIGCGNSLHFTTCLVRPVKNEKIIGPKLAKRGLWHKHHRVEKGDQYYQLGETQKN